MYVYIMLLYISYVIYCRCLFFLLFLITDLGAAFGTAKSGVGVCSVGVMRPDLIMKSILPVVMAGVLGIYGIIMSIIISGKS